MPWTETEEQNRRLLEALQQLAKEEGALGRLAGAISADERAHKTDDARSGDEHKDFLGLIDATTLDRWQKGGLARIKKARPHKKRLVFEFLERSPDFLTPIYRPLSQLPFGLLDYAGEHGGRITQPFTKDLSKLDGAFELYRPAWTTPSRRDRILISRLQFKTEGGFTRFREEQDYIDAGFHDAQINEIDEGAVMFTAACIVMFGLGVNAERVKFFVADSWHDALNGPLPVTRLSGTMMGVSGRKQHPGFPFVAIRTKKPFAEIETGIIAPDDSRLDREIAGALGLDKA